MKRLLHSQSLSSGFALFSMFFGAGNLIFPLALGVFAASGHFYAMLGLIITAVIVPFLGVIAILYHDGDYLRFFARLGSGPGFVLALAIITLIGPLGCTPRCIALSLSTVKVFFPLVPSLLFNAVFCFVIFLFALRKNKTVEMLGKILTPILLVSLGFIIIRGFLSDGVIETKQAHNFSLFIHGLIEGYNTMDLLAAFFFSSTVVAMLKTKREESSSGFCHYKKTLKAVGIGAFILTVVYLSFSHIAAGHAQELQYASKDRLLTALAMKVAGPLASVAVSVTVAITCLTTAIALISVFTEFVHIRLLRSRLSYSWILATSLLVTFAMSCIEFQGITAFLAPILMMFYPGLIVLTLLSFFAKKIPSAIFRPLVIASFIASVFIYFFI